MSSPALFRLRLRRAWIVAALAMLTSALLSAACGGQSGSGTPKVDADALRKAGNALAEQANWAGAIEEYTKAIEANPKSDLAYESRGVAYTELGELDKAIADLSKAIEIAPKRGGPPYARGIAYRKQGKPDEAIADLSKAMGDRDKTKFRGALYERGLAYKASGNTAEARADFQRILKLEQDFPGEADKEWAEKAQKELAQLGT